ncbi:MAG: endolytic transglycosylase MltG, partial [Bacteroidales bacterium]|nr:endolytic transglycosylase MltG [Bacteroidales bacterium]
KRVLFSHLKTESPYNTYIHKGLPPGPICTPTLSSINAVLKNEKHPYYYFCANPDFSGTHLFATTSEEHAKNAAAYHKALETRREERRINKAEQNI